MPWLNWSGGGNLPPSLGIARVLEAAGTRCLSPAARRWCRVSSEPAFAPSKSNARHEQADRYPQDKWMPKNACYLTSPAVGEEIREMLPRENPDVVIVDQMFPAALLEAKRFGRPSVAVCHTCVWRGLQTWRKCWRQMVSLRAEAGFAPIPADLESLWMAQDRMIVTTLGALDNAPGDLGEAHKLRHVGPVLERERHGVRVALPWPDDDARPLVLVSFSTMPEQGSVKKFQTVIEALSRSPVRGVVTVGDSVDPRR